MRPEIFHTFGRNNLPKHQELPRITYDEIKESLNFFAGLAMEAIKASHEVAKKEGLRALGRELKSLKSLRLDFFKK